MKQLNKSQSIQLAKEMIRKNREIYKLTLAQAQEIVPLEWSQRRAAAHEMAVTVLTTLKDGAGDRPHPQYEQAWLDQYTNDIITIWMEPIQEHQRKVKEWRRWLVSGTPYTTARTRLRELFDAMKVPGAVFEDNLSIRVGVGQSWHSAEVQIYIKFDRDYDNYITNPDDPKQRLGWYESTVEISSGGTSRSLALAIKHVNALKQAIAITAELQSYLDETRVMWTDGIPEEKPVQEPVGEPVEASS